MMFGKIDELLESLDDLKACIERLIEETRLVREEMHKLGEIRVIYVVREGKKDE